MNKIDTSAEILILEDHDKPFTTLAQALTQEEEEGFRVQSASNPREVLKLLRKRRPDMILLDLTLLGEEFGITLCEKILQEEDEQASIILISEKGSQENKVRGFEAGADDYLVKPLSVREVRARINAHLKRRNYSSQGYSKKRIIEAGDLSIDVKNFRACVKGEPLELKVKEFRVLAALATHPGELRSWEELVQEIWEEDKKAGSKRRALDVQIARLRRALKEKSDYEYIHTTRKLGYRFEAKLKHSLLEESLR